MPEPSDEEKKRTLEEAGKVDSTENLAGGKFKPRAKNPFMETDDGKDGDGK